jgi:hypothetical protein
MRDLNVLALVKGAERFVFVYDDDSRAETIAAIRDHAADPTVSLNWFDAAVLTERARNQGDAAVPVPDDSTTSRM